MSTYLKPIMVLLISVLIFAGAAYLADRDFLDFIQTRFYNPSVVKSYVKENTTDAEIAQNHILELQNVFASTLDEPAIRRSFLYNQTDEDIFERSRIYGILLETTSGLQSVQFVDSNGIRIHYSTSPNDIIIQGADSTSYRNYTEDPLALPYEIVSVSANDSGKFTMDEHSDRIIYSFPFIDSMDVYRGTAVFSVAIRSLSEKLVTEGRLKVSDDVSVIESPPGILLGSPGTSKTDIFSSVSRVWNDSIQGRVILDAEDSGVKFSLISSRTGQGIFFGRLVNDTLFYISDSMKNILYLSMFLTLYLALFLLVNLKPHTVTIVQSRLSRLRNNLFKQLYENKSDKDKEKWILELEQRREEVHLGLKNKLKMTRRTEKHVDRLIDHAWDELLAVVKISSTDSLQTAEKAKETRAKLPEDIDDVEAIEEVEALEEVEELDNIEEAEVLEEVEELDDIEEAEALEEVEELGDIEEVEALEEVEELGDIEEVEALEEVEELGDIEEVEALEEVEELGDIEEVEALEEIEELGDIEEAEEFEKEKPLEKGNLEDIDNLNKIEIVDDVDVDDIDDFFDDVSTSYEPEKLKEAPVPSAKKERKPRAKKETQPGKKPKTPAKKAKTGDKPKAPSKKTKTADKPKTTVKKRKAASENEKPAAKKRRTASEKDTTTPKKRRASSAKKDLQVEKETISAVSEAKIPLVSEITTPAEPVASEPTIKTRRGLLALASEIEFSRENPSSIDETEEDINTESFDIVSPFSSMFSSLNSDNEEEEKAGD